jgi:hypothetical protein
MHIAFTSAGEHIELTCHHRRLAAVLAEGIGDPGPQSEDAGADIRITVEDTGAAFESHGWDVLTRDAWRRPGQVMVRDACSSGLDLVMTTGGPTLDIVARWRPSPAGRAASALLRSRSRLLVRAVLLQYPALWWAQQRGRVPLHASVCSVGPDHNRSVLLAGPGGVGKSTMINAELARGAIATSDNVCVSDGTTTWGLLEPRRVPADEGENRHGRRMPHDRREAPWAARVDQLVPDLVVVLQRHGAQTTTAAACDPAEAAKALTAGTYMAGELRRYWAFSSTLALGTGIGEAHPRVDETARALTAGVPCWDVILGEKSATSLEQLLATRLADGTVGR